MILPNCGMRSQLPTIFWQHQYYDLAPSKTHPCRIFSFIVGGIAYELVECQAVITKGYIPGTLG